MRYLISTMRPSFSGAVLSRGTQNQAEPTQPDRKSVTREEIAALFADSLYAAARC